ncbi:MAG: DUF6470 family protein [Candidatus Wallacebacter cryptica]|nr:hypothetical protein [Bacillota bacterium]
MHLSISTKYPQVLISYYWPQTQIRQQVGNFEFKYDGPVIEIDQQDALNELGMGDLNHLVRTAASAGNEAVLSGTARRAQEGDRFAREMTLQNTAAQLAKEQLFREIPEINVDYAPKSRPRIKSSYELNMEWQQGGTMIDIAVYPPKVDWIDGGVKVRFERGSKFDVKG